MAKGKNLKKPKFKKNKVQFRTWLENKIIRIRNLSERRAYRTAKRYGGPSSVVLLIIFVGYSLFLPKSQFQQAKEQLTQNPNDLQAHLILAEKFLENNQFEKAGKELLIAKTLQKNNFELNRLWQKKHQLDPQDVQQLIEDWKKIVAEKPDFRDAYLNLARLYFQLFENEKAKNYLQKAINCDPNYEAALNLQKFIN